MKNVKQLFYLTCGFALMLSCNSNSLKQDQAEKTILEFLTNNSSETSQGIINSGAIQKIEKVNIFSQFNSSVTAYFNSKERERSFSLSFIFTRNHDNKWFLKSIEAGDGSIPELTGWLKTKKNLNIAVE